jgi:hypothetical protein
MQTHLRWLLVMASATLLSAGVAQANTATEGASSLMPVELRAVSLRSEGSSLNSVADQVNQSMAPAEDDSTDVTDIIQVPFLEDLLDENGSVALPMGLTVFTTLGDPSVGFSSKF